MRAPKGPNIKLLTVLLKIEESELLSYKLKITPVEKFFLHIVPFLLSLIQTNDDHF